MGVSPVEALTSLEDSLRDALRRETEESERRQQAAEIQKQAWDQQTQALSVPDFRKGGREFGHDEEEFAQSALGSMQAKESHIQRRRVEVRLKVQAQLSRVQEEARGLEELRKELESLEDPTKKEVAEIRKKIELVDREIRPLKQLCEKKEKELKEAVATFNEKSKLKTDLITRLMEIVTESERARMHKLEELNRLLEAMEKPIG